MRHILLIGILLGLCASECNDSNMKDDRLSIIMESYDGDQLELDGFYFFKDQHSEEELFIRYFFYRNGVLRNENAQELNDFSFGDGSYKIDWGLYDIIQDTIRFEKWYPSSGGPLRAYVREGVILNDTSFHIDKSYRMIDGERKEVRERDELYQFYQYSPKPDSTSHYLN